MTYIISLLRRIFIGSLLVLILCILLRLLILRRRFSGLCIAHKSKAKGIILGTLWTSPYVLYSPCKAEKHVIVLGGTGDGKTSALLIPTLQSWQGGAYVIDISGDISSNVDCKNKLVYDLESETTKPYNIFAGIDKMVSYNKKNEALAQLAFLIMPEQINMNAAAKYYYEGGRRILTAALIAGYHEDMDFCEICEKIIKSDYRTLFNYIEAKNDYAATYISGFYRNSEANISGCKAECDTAIALFAQNEKIYNSLRRPHEGEQAISPGCLEHSKVFLRIEDYKLELYAPLTALITAQVLQYISARPNNAKTTILLALDEFASLGRQQITPPLRKFRKKHVRIMILTQSLADIDMIYGADERVAMLNNLAFKVILSVTDPDTQQYFSRLCGRKKTVRTSTSSSGLVTKTETDECAVEPSILGYLHPNLLLIHQSGYCFLRKNYYFK